MLPACSLQQPVRRGVVTPTNPTSAEPASSEVARLSARAVQEDNSMRPFAVGLFVAAAWAVYSPARAQDAIRTEEVRFPAGKTGTTLRGDIVGRGSVS
jgi:hypothetical protein